MLRDSTCAERRSIGAVRAGLVVMLATLTATGCTPLDDLLAWMTPNRSMRNSISFDPHENPRMPDSTSVSFASGNFPAARGQVNVGAPVGLVEDLPPFTNADMAFQREIADALVNPVAADQASLARGRVVFNRYCAVCHGLTGSSADAPIASAPSIGPLMQIWNLTSGTAPALTDGYIYGMIRVGRSAMPAYGARIPHFDRWHVVNYVRELQAQAAGGN